MQHPAMSKSHIRCDLRLASGYRELLLCLQHVAYNATATDYLQQFICNCLLAMLFFLSNKNNDYIITFEYSYECLQNSEHNGKNRIKIG